MTDQFNILDRTDLTVDSITMTAGGQILLDNGTAAAVGLAFANDPQGDTGLFSVGQNSLSVAVNAAERIRIGVSEVLFHSANTLSWGSSGVSTPDLILARDAPNTFAQRNGTNPQTDRVYNTFTDASNYERGVFDWTTTANTLIIGTQAAGTGNNRSLELTAANDIRISADGSVSWEFVGNAFRPPSNNASNIGSAGRTVENIFVGTSVLYEEVTAPSGIADTARVFSEDNGSGKTRWMVQFGTGAAVQIAIEP